jgi:hypothetical protein
MRRGRAIVGTDNDTRDPARPSHFVIFLGLTLSRLGHLADKLQENDLAAVRVLHKRYAEAVGHMPFVASIAITPIAKG